MSTAAKCRSPLGNTIEPQAVIKQSGADILRLWVAACDYTDDQRIGPENPEKNTVETYRKLRQHDPLDARHASPFQAGRGSRPRRDAGTGSGICCIS